MKVKLSETLVPLCVLSGFFSLLILTYGEPLATLEFFFGFLVLVLAAIALSRLERPK